MENIESREYEQLKSAAINFETFQIKVKLKDVDIDKYGGLSIRGLTMGADKDLVEEKLLKNILNISPRFIRIFENNNLNDAKKSIIDIIKAGLSLADVKKSEVTFVSDQFTKNIIDIIPGKNDYISNRLACVLFEKAMNSRNDLTFKSGSLNRHGVLQLDAQTKFPVEPKMLQSLMKGEEFLAGYSFRNSGGGGLQLKYFLERLICTNGMTSIGKTLKSAVLRTMTEKSIAGFQSKFDALSNENFIPYTFGEDVRRAMETKISFYELYSTACNFVNNSKIEIDSVEMSQVLPEFTSSVKSLAAKGIDYLNKEVCTPIKLKNLITGYNVWDVVNRATWFGSHDMGFNEKRTEIQKYAGELFNKKKFNSENILIL